MARGPLVSRGRHELLLQTVPQPGMVSPGEDMWVCSPNPFGQTPLSNPTLVKPLWSDRPRTGREPEGLRPSICSLPCPLLPLCTTPWV